MIETRQLGIDDLDSVAPLFDLYRQFYGQAPDATAARDFIAARLENEDSFLIGVFDAGGCVGFTQLYPSFSSVGMKRKLILNDMYVAEASRRSGAARALLLAAEALGETLGAGALLLATQKDNAAARRLYEASGWTAENDFIYYNRALGTRG